MMRLTPEQEAAINEFLRSGEYMTAQLATVRAAYGVHVGTLLADRSILLDIASQAIGREMNLLEAALSALRDAGVPEAPQELNAPQAVILGIGLLRRQLEDAQEEALEWSSEPPMTVGQYWYWGTTGKEVVQLDQYVKNESAARSGWLVWRWGYGERFLVEDSSGAWWAGPIALPPIRKL